MSYSEQGRVWEDYLERVNRTISAFAPMNQTCENTIKSMWLINSEIFETVKTRWGKQVLPSHQVFVSVYYRRNIIYLQSSHALACIGFLDPSSNLNRTVYETLLRGYLFTVDQKEAEEYFHIIGTKDEDNYNFNKGASYLRRKLYTFPTRKKHKKLYKELCISAHPNIKGVALDYPDYLPDRVRNSLKMILFLIYGNIQMMAECFFCFLDIKTRTIVKLSLNDIASISDAVPSFEPDGKSYSSKVRLKHGNFLKVL